MPSSSARSAARREKSSLSSPDPGVAPPDEFQREVIDLFVRGVKVLGLPKSYGEIYGLLYISPEPLPLDTIVVKLGISKGSASQGLRFLRNLGAIEGADAPGERREHFRAVAELKQLASGFIRGELLPHLDSGRSTLDALKAMADSDSGPDATFNKRRINRLDAWSRRGGALLKLVERFMR